MANGTCQLCLKNGPLCESHYLPRGFYSRLHESAGKGAIWVNRDFTIMQTRQVTAPLLCRGCETLFNKRGEKWAFQFLAKSLTANKTGVGLSFPVRSLLRHYQADKQDNQTAIYYGGHLPQMRVTELIYFATSIFWRGGIRDWCMGGHTFPRLDIPPTLMQRLGQYLLGAAEFPSDECALVCEVALHPELIITFPKHMTDAEGVGMYLLGLTAKLVFGSTLTDKVTRFATDRQPFPVYLTDIGIELLRGHAANIARESPRKGVLANPNWRP